MPFTPFGVITVILNDVQTFTTHMSLHTAYDANGAFEVVGGAYARQPVTLQLAFPGGNVFPVALAPTAQLQFALPAGQSIGFFGLWDLNPALVTDKRFVGMFPRFGSPLFPVTCDELGVFTLPFQTIGLSVGFPPPVDGQVTFTNTLHNASVLLWSAAASPAANGFNVGQTYYVVNDDPSTYTFQLSATPPIGTPSIPGPPIAPLAPFSCLLQTYVPTLPLPTDSLLIVNPKDGQFQFAATAGQ